MNSIREDYINEMSNEGAINTFLGSIAFFLFSYNAIHPRNIFLIIASFLGIIYFILTLFRTEIDNRFLIFGSLLLIGSLFNLPFSKNGIGGSLVLLGTLSISVFCIRNITTTLFYSFIVLLYFCIIIFNGIVIQGEDSYFLFDYMGKSRNYIGYLLVTYSSLYYFLSVLCKKKPSVLLLSVVVFLCFLAQGRTSLGMSLLLLLGSIILIGEGRRLGITFFMIIVLCVLLYSTRVLLGLWYESSNFSSKQLESARYTIWNSYFKSLSICDIIYGKDLNTVPLIREWDGNVHNSYLKFHARVGLIGVIPFLLLLLRSLVIIIKDNRILFIPVIALLIRIFFDSDMLIGELDFVLYTILWIPVMGIYNNSENYK